jgi:hypothetical protein
LPSFDNGYFERQSGIFGIFRGGVRGVGATSNKGQKGEREKLVERPPLLSLGKRGPFLRVYVTGFLKLWPLT